MLIDKCIKSNFLIIAPDTLLSDAIAVAKQAQKTQPAKSIALSGQNQLDCILVGTAEKLIGIITKGDVLKA
ncbi:MAG: hypothetical protein QNJ53_25655, partial [Pleurocapsa sp. MO_192.B19]|nr:hypothetical protein [Pleurocapsa sp. MO_192.B19]